MNRLIFLLLALTSIPTGTFADGSTLQISQDGYGLSSKISQTNNINTITEITQRGINNELDHLQETSFQITSKLSQTGSGNSITLAQINLGGSDAGLIQDGAANSINLYTTGSDVTILSLQKGENNTIESELDSNSLVFQVEQVGSGNQLTSSQHGDFLNLSIQQYGDMNTASLTQGGNGNSIRVTQSGNGNLVKITQD